MTALLLDTHTFYWWVSSPELISTAADRAIAGAGRVVVSDVSLFELVLKERTAHPVVGSGDIAGWFREALRRTAFEPLPIAREHIGAVQHLPPVHRDPFDRLLVAQARLERCSLVSRDRRIASYDVPVIW